MTQEYTDDSDDGDISLLRAVVLFGGVFIVTFVFVSSLPITMSVGQSMQPEFSTCEFHVYDPVVDESQLTEGQVILYTAPEGVNVIHRIYDVESEYSPDSQYKVIPEKDKFEFTTTDEAGEITTSYHSAGLTEESADMYGEPVYITKGDNNSVIDPYLTQHEDITGVQLYSYDAPEWVCEYNYKK